MISKLHVYVSSAALALFISLTPLRADELDAAVPEPAVEAAPSIGSTALQPVERTLMITKPEFFYRYLWADGVLSAPGTERTTSINFFALTLHWNIGDYLKFRYTPSWTFYSNSAFDENIGHQAVLTYEQGFSVWNVRATNRYSRTEIPLIETGQQTKVNSDATTLRAQRSIGAHTTLDLGLSQNLRSTENFSDFSEWGTEDWVHFEHTPQLSTSIGAVYGYVDVSDGSDMSYQQIRGRIRWHLTDKIHLDARGGLETREFRDSELGTSRTPVYGASVQYTPVETTTVILSAERIVAPSYFKSEFNRTTTWQASLSQRLLGRLHLNLDYVHFSATRRSSALAVSTVRHDDARSIRAKLSTDFRSRGMVAVFYENKRNHSSDNAFNFQDDEFGAEVTFRF